MLHPTGRVPHWQSNRRLRVHPLWPASSVGHLSERVDKGIAELERLKLGLPECNGCGGLSLERRKLAIRRRARLVAPPSPR